MNKGDIQNFISNPLIIIGNGPSVLGKGWGSVIDSRFQTVVRINDFVTEGHEEDVGSRTDLWVTGASHKAIIKNRSLYRHRTIAVCKHSVLELICLKDRVGVEAEKAFLLSVEDTNTIRKESGLKKPSAGMKAIFSFLIIFEVPNIYVLGFDFFLDTGKNHYYEDNSKEIGMGHNWEDEKRVFDKLLKRGKISMIDKIMDKTTEIKSISQKEREKYNVVHNVTYKGGDFKGPRQLAFKEGSAPFYSHLKEIIQHETESLLDAGCGKGNFGSIIRDMHPALFMDGTDISDSAIEYCKEIKVYNNLYRSDLSVLDIPKKYDMVMFLDGMEHIHKEVEEEVFANLYKHSKKYIVLSISTVPAVQDKNSIAAGYGKVHVNLKSVEEWLGFFNRMKETYPFEILTFTKNKMDAILKK